MASTVSAFGITIVFFFFSLLIFGVYFLFPGCFTLKNIPLMHYGDDDDFLNPVADAMHNIL